jgi:hypothetical protein
MKLKNFLLVVFLLAIAGMFVACNGTVVSITLDADFDITAGDTVALNAKVIGLEEYELIYTPGDDTIVSVSASGEVTALKAGSTTIEIGIKDYADVTASVNVKVKPKVEFDDYAPTKVELVGSEELALNTSTKLTATVTPETAKTALIWESDNQEVAVVLSDGTVLAMGLGSAKITAKSAIKDSVFGELTINVVDSATDQEIVDSAVEYLISQLPEYVHETFTLPTHPNSNITVEWKNSLNQVKTQYDFAATRDGFDTLSLKVAYGDALKTQSVSLKLVVDLSKNVHENLPIAEAAVDAYFDALGADVTGDLLLYKEVKGVKITWTSGNTDIIKSDGTFIRPANDTEVSLSAFIGHTGLSKTREYKIIAKGYTDEEKVDYILNQGTLKQYIDMVTASNVSLPTVDDKFGAKLIWVSGNPAVANNNGSYVNVNIAEDTTVEFTVTIKYEVTGFDFEEDVKINITYKPLDEIGKAVNSFLASDFELPKQVVFGTSAHPSQLTNLPTTVDGHEGVTIEWYGKEGEFDENMNVLIPRILYTPTEVYAKFSKEGYQDAIVAFPINIGILTGEEDEFAFTVRTLSYVEGLDQHSGMPKEENGIDTVYALGFEGFYFKSTFTRTVGDKEITKTWYHFFAPGNVIEYTSEHLKDVDGKKFVDKTITSAVIKPNWSSTTRFMINTTDDVIYVHKDDVVALGAQAGTEQYKPFVLDKDGKVTTVATPAMAFAPEGFTAYEIPVGGMLVLPGYLEAAVNINLHYFAEELGREIEIIKLTGWDTYTAPVPAE